MLGNFYRASCSSLPVITKSRVLPSTVVHGSTSPGLEKLHKREPEFEKAEALPIFYLAVYV